MNYFPDSMTLGEARATFRRMLKDGQRVVCPGCELLTTQYHRPLNSGMARILLSIFHATTHQEWCDVSKTFGDEAHKKEYSKLKHWGLLEEMPGEGTEGHTTGLWRLPAASRKFCEEQGTVLKYVDLVNDVLIERSGPEITIRDALGKRFSFDEIMGRGLNAEDSCAA